MGGSMRNVFIAAVILSGMARGTSVVVEFLRG
jgi:hypothetical protein